MSANINDLLALYSQEVEEIYDEGLDEILLYGAHARGDFSLCSDVDVMILVNLPEEEIAEYSHRLSSITKEFNGRNRIDIKPIVKSGKMFRDFANRYPFYKNVSMEGVALYSAGC